MYALAATASGVGLLALVQPAEGEIIYTKTHKSIHPNTTFHLDLNNDGIADFDLKDTHTSTFYGGGAGLLSALPDRQQNAIWGHSISRRVFYASALSANAQVGPNGQFLPGPGEMATTFNNGGGRRPQSYNVCGWSWANVSNRYLGLKFVITGQVHFGWARLNVSCRGFVVTATLTGYAYESVANRPILTGKEHGTWEHNDTIPPSDGSATLGRLAQGRKNRTPVE
jgi:hypothetical protein